MKVIKPLGVIQAERERMNKVLKIVALFISLIAIVITFVLLFQAQRSMNKVKVLNMEIAGASSQGMSKVVGGR